MDLVVENEPARLRRELERMRAENARLSRLLDLRDLDTAPAPEQLSATVRAPGLVVMSSPVQHKLALYADRFRARIDVYPVRWDNVRTGASGWMPAVADDVHPPTRLSKVVNPGQVTGARSLGYE